MINKDNLKEVLEILGFKNEGEKYKKTYQNSDKIFIEIDFKLENITYAPLDSSFKEGEYPSEAKKSKGFIIHRHTTTNFSSNENFVCLVAIDKLLSKGYKPEHIILEPMFKVGHKNQVYGDILILKQTYEPLILIENKTAGSEFTKEWNNTQKDGGQLFSYYAVNRADFLCLLSFDYDQSSKDYKEKISYKSYIITMLDNEEHLDRINANLKDEDKKIRFDSPENTNAKAYFRVWTDSYQQSKTEKGLLEEDILSYKIGKEKYNTKDLKAVSYNEISSIYHEFATILRNHAIGNYENTFYILVDLFLCKITDERYNAKDLQFYYKGTMYDNPFSYIDRLLNLYEKGIQDLFKKNIVNVKKEEIDELFSTAKRYKGKFKADLDKLFDKQRYFQIKKFNFIDIENEEEFFLNFQILTKIASLIQDFYISKSDNNQFLGDLFEGFLNRSVHQTEGRFFTPTPITNFIIHSLPDLDKDAKVLDFACGAGHFLTELMPHSPNSKLYGIEKNKDLSKVAQIACKIHDYNRKSSIIFQDSLDFVKESYKDDFKDSSFDLILSNPPYSVKGFLSTLQEAVLKKYELEKEIDIKSYDKNNAIECFFIERAKQLLKPNGLIALILPVSILQKSGVYEKTREILFKYFKILCLIELNSRTFSSTGTQTIIIFAKRVEKYGLDLLNKLKENNFDDNLLQDDFKDEGFLQKYCSFMDYNYDDFKAFLQGQKEEILDNEVFLAYKADFESQKPKFFKKPKANENKAERKQRFLSGIKELESEKMLYFSFIQDEEVLILKSPQDKDKANKSNKINIVKFLGYDWSKRKGDEGIKYQTTKQDDESLKEAKDDNDEEKKEKEALRNINSVKYIDTPLYNPQNKDDETKLSTAIKAFIAQDENKQSIIASLQSKDEDFYKLFSAPLKSLINFKLVDFNKAISLNIQSGGGRQIPLSILNMS